MHVCMRQHLAALVASCNLRAISALIAALGGERLVNSIPPFSFPLPSPLPHIDPPLQAPTSTPTPTSTLTPTPQTPAQLPPSSPAATAAGATMSIYETRTVGMLPAQVSTPPPRLPALQPPPEHQLGEEVTTPRSRIAATPQELAALEAQQQQQVRVGEER